MGEEGGTLERARAEVLDEGALAAVVTRVLAGATVTSVTPMEGGLGSVMDLVGVKGDPDDVGAVVLRRLLPEWGDDAASLRREVLTHRVLGAEGLPVPEILWHDGEGSVLGRPALLMRHVGGSPMARDLDRPAARQALGEAAARLHALPADSGAHLARLVTVDDYLDHYGVRPAVSEIVDAVALHASLTRGPVPATTASCLVHGDLHGGNVLWDGHVVTALLDWTGAARGDAWWDVAYLWLDTALAVGSDAADGLVDAYLAAGGVDADEHTRWFWRGVALARALPTPAAWLPAYVGSGLTELTDALLEERFAMLVTHHLQESP